MNYEKILESLGAEEEHDNWLKLKRTGHGMLDYGGLDPEDEIMLIAEIEAAFEEEGASSFFWDIADHCLEIAMGHFDESRTIEVPKTPSKLDAYCKAWAEYKGLEL